MKSNTKYNAGFSQLTIPFREKALSLALWYPSTAPLVDLRIGPFHLKVAIDTPAAPGKHPVIVLSHGSGTSPLSHRRLASTLASNGYIVAAPLHPQDNWRDKSGIGSFVMWGERPLALSCVIDYILGHNPHDLIPDVEKIGLYGHSVGGYATLALASGHASVRKIIDHCTSNSDDSLFCSYGGDSAQTLAMNCAALPDFRDERVKCVAVSSPIVVPIFSDSLAAIAVPTLAFSAEKEEFLNNKYNIEVLRNNVPREHMNLITIKSATHFSFIEPIDAKPDSQKGSLLTEQARAKEIHTEVNHALLNFFITHL